jgi:ribosomal protein L40E
MARRGRCRCGFLLEVHKGPEGYKTRCPSCGAIVRLKPVAARSAVKKRKISKPIDPRPAPLPQWPAMAAPPSEADPSEGRTVTCEVCYALVPAQASNCPDCGSVLDRTLAASALEGEESALNLEAPQPWLRRRRGVWLAGGVALLIAAVILILSLWH